MNAETVWAILFVGSALLNLYLINRLVGKSDKYRQFKAEVRGDE